MDEPRRPGRAASLPLEPQRGHAPGRRRSSQSAGGAARRRDVAFLRCAYSSQAEPGSSAPTSPSGCSPPGDDVVVLDKLTYSGQSGEPRGHRRSSSSTATSAIATAVAAGGAPAATRSSTSPPRRTSTARSSARPTSAGRSSSERRCCSRKCARDRCPLRPGLDGRGLRRPRRRRLLGRDRSGQAVEPVQRREGGRRPPHPGVRADVRRQRLDHARLEHLRAEPVPGEADPAVRRRTRSRESRCPIYGDGQQVRDWLYVEDHCAGIETRAARGRSGRGLQRRRRRRARERGGRRPRSCGSPAPTSR